MVIVNTSLAMHNQITIIDFPFNWWEYWWGICSGTAAFRNSNAGKYSMNTRQTRSMYSSRNEMLSLTEGNHVSSGSVVISAHGLSFGRCSPVCHTILYSIHLEPVMDDPFP